MAITKAVRDKTRPVGNYMLNFNNEDIRKMSMEIILVSSLLLLNRYILLVW